MPGRKKRGIPWRKCEVMLGTRSPNGGRPCGATSTFREASRCSAHAAKAVDSVLTDLENAEELDADRVTSTVSLPIIGRPELRGDEWELHLALGTWIAQRHPELAAAIALDETARAAEPREE